MTLLPYYSPSTLIEARGNNAFSWNERKAYYQKKPTLYVPSLIVGSLEDVQIGTEIVFEEMQDGVMYSCVGLAHFVQLSDAPHNVPTYIFDNHHHALRFWIYGVKTGIIAPGYTLIHIDEHSDLWHNPHTLDLDRALKDDTYAQEFTQYDCNVGNYIQPALDSGLIGSIIRIENEYQMDAILTSTIPEKSILNLDLDIFSPELAHIPRKKILDTISWALAHVTFVTIATSPFFIDQHKAIRALQDIWKHAKQ